MGYSFQLAARNLLYTPSHRQDNSHHALCYTICRALAGVIIIIIIIIKIIKIIIKTIIKIIIIHNHNNSNILFFINTATNVL